jgi:hypothetical protein
MWSETFFGNIFINLAVIGERVVKQCFNRSESGVQSSREWSHDLENGDINYKNWYHNICQNVKFNIRSSLLLKANINLQP